MNGIIITSTGQIVQVLYGRTMQVNFYRKEVEKLIEQESGM